jgi:hypothetical protein
MWRVSSDPDLVSQQTRGDGVNLRRPASDKIMTGSVPIIVCGQSPAAAFGVLVEAIGADDN